MERKAAAYLIIIMLAAGSVFSQSPREKKKLLAGKITMGNGMREVSPMKADAALALAVSMTEEYDLIEAYSRDSAVAELKKYKETPSITDLADAFMPEAILFVNVSRLANMLRVEIGLVNGRDREKRSSGKGFANIRLRVVDTAGIESSLMDPALLKATQRALAQALANDSLYEAQPEGYDVRPVPTLVIGGIYYNDNGIKSKWKLFENKVVNSYDNVETIFEVAIKSRDYAVFDTDSRDSVYALFNFYGVENYNAPTIDEIDALEKLEVDYFIFGQIDMREEKAEIRLFLNKIANGKTHVQKTEIGLLKEDSLEKMRAEIRKMAVSLLDME